MGHPVYWTKRKRTYQKLKAQKRYENKGKIDNLPGVP